MLIPNQAGKLKFYGNPDKNRDGRADKDWERNNIIAITPPFQMYYPKEVKGKIIKRGVKWSKLRVHRKCAVSLLAILNEIKQVFTKAEIEKFELDLCGGVHTFRLKRNGSGLSEHSWGIAIDLSHLINFYGRSYVPSDGMMPLRVVAIFEKHGWVWLRNKDCMHFQAVKFT